MCIKDRIAELEVIVREEMKQTEAYKSEKAALDAKYGKTLGPLIEARESLTKKIKTSLEASNDKTVASETFEVKLFQPTKTTFVEKMVLTALARKMFGAEEEALQDMIIPKVVKFALSLVKVTKPLYDEAVLYDVDVTPAKQTLPDGDKIVKYKLLEPKK